MTRQRLDIHRLTGLAGTGPSRTATLEAMLREERQALGAATDTWEHHIVSANVETLEEAIAKSQRNDEARTKREADIAAKKQAEAARQDERRERLAEAEKAEIRRQYMGSNPSATDAEFEAAFPTLRERHRERQMDAREAQARAAMRSRL